ncbi:hypothetical protein OEZ86_010081 [Tetradesmus obliquus]|uniref:Methylated-DNA--protein-cysteine methyltransferase n=1 Tax=Tetradesmus obliquus TaxID=3088 RepID=A0ABY8USB4_TETOB|nr:hypothetical protein OEZ85_001516 [Tetradesmus obliquus]WIA43641.1 hypothetical protein OEZ86_010081 [Tetradesmus obliquus]
MGHRRAPKRMGPCMSPPVTAEGGVSKPNRPPTAYEQRVYEMCKAIPKGKVSTYGDMAKALSSSARAVGQAMRRNPFAPVVPCHRVVASSLDLGGFSGSWVSIKLLRICFETAAQLSSSSSDSRVGQLMKHTGFGALAKVVELQGVTVVQLSFAVLNLLMLASSLDLGGFSGSWGISCANVQRKKAMLQAEGVQFLGDKILGSKFMVTAENLTQLVQQQQQQQQQDGKQH